MAKVEMDAPPGLPSGAVYGEYMPWLLQNFFDRTCAYCLARHLVLAIDHFEPQRYAPTRVKDPTNLLPACGNCNGKGGKGDYHPAHAARTRLPHDRTGHMPVDVRHESLGDLYAVEANGQLSVAGSRNPARATWNATVLLKLDRPALEAYVARSSGLPRPRLPRRTSRRCSSRSARSRPRCPITRSRCG